MHILVTGGAGFIGMHVCSYLLRDNHQLTIVDNLDPYYDPDRKKKQLEQVKRTGDFQFYNVDLRNEDKCLSVFKANHFDAVIHLAALPGVAYSIKEPLAYVQYDIEMTINVLKSAGETAVPHIIFSSSSSVYGDKASLPLSEEMADGKVVSPYAASKFGAESFCHSYQHIYGFQLSILRFFTVYGPWARPDMAIPKFTHQLSEGYPIEIYGNETARDYTYIDDIVEGVNAVLYHKHQNETFNLGYGEPISMERLLEIFRQHYPSMEIIQKPWRTGDVVTTWSDITKAKSELGFNPTTSIDEGIKRMVQWIESWKG
ncbi:NAD-dependent epimerase/dehydratase family protein [Pontibacillus yanchengensis]|uniref:NAD-dependent epimerase/dehydratase family protein n=2 Tax=Pontibacillus yanchengensis TaxID=462910 RepID=A0ACC7VDQ8_9BACI|nr:NAD-dependent epimerase/dehydratase family protein [Pontibacillus yanchengensis]MYL34744.1 NAD-dependent epimerase/dehydratase family protein [Pontibacillus yanchengensis]MYL52270.1 NAD-dependent epimerase/dehydratase family protein [Pontibacillus yanchengensis]